MSSSSEDDDVCPVCCDEDADVWNHSMQNMCGRHVDEYRDESKRRRKRYRARLETLEEAKREYKLVLDTAMNEIHDSVEAFVDVMRLAAARKRDLEPKLNEASRRARKAFASKAKELGFSKSVIKAFKPKNAVGEVIDRIEKVSPHLDIETVDDEDLRARGVFFVVRAGMGEENSGDESDECGVLWEEEYVS